MNASACGTCESPRRELWPPVAKLPQLPAVATGNWTELLSCPECGCRWMDVGWEPHGMFHYRVRWVLDADQWCALRDLDADANILHKWHRARTQQLVSTLASADDLSAIERHRERSYGRDPASEAERSPQLLPDIRSLLRREP